MWQPAQIAALSEVLISTHSDQHGLGDTFRVTGGIAEASAVWQTANRALYMPLYIERPGIVTKFWTYNGAAVAGNIDIGLYREDYTLISSKGSTAQAGTNVLQEFDVTDFAIVPGVYFLGLVSSSTTATFFGTGTGGGISGFLRCMGVTQQDLGATTLPAPAVPAVLGSGVSNLPDAGIAFRTLVA